MRTLNLFANMRLSRADDVDRRATPVVVSFVILLTLTQLVGSVLAFFEISAGNYLNLTKESLVDFEVWRLATFSFSCFAPSTAALDRAPLFASILIYSISMTALFASGVATEERLGSMPTTLLFIVVIFFQALFSVVVFGQGADTAFGTAFSPLAVILSMLTMAQLVEFERNDPRREAELDFRVVLMSFIIILSAVAAALYPPFKPLLVALVVGPLFAIVAFAVLRKAEREALRRVGHGGVGGLYYAEESEMLTVEELRARTDKLLSMIAKSGYESLTKEEHRFLSRASQRLREIRSDEPEDQDGPTPV